MRRALLIAAAAAGLAYSAPAHAAFINGNKLYDECKAENVKSATQWQSAAFCIAFVFGVVDSLSYDKKCFPEEIIGSQVKDVVIDYLKSHPATRQTDATDLVQEAVREAFCQ